MIRFRVIALWITIMVGFTLHNLADMMPLFWNADIVVEPSGTAPTGLLFFMMAVSYLIPVVGLLCVSYTRKAFGTMCNFVLALLSCCSTCSILRNCLWTSIPYNWRYFR